MLVTAAVLVLGSWPLPAQADGVPSFSHVFLIIGENTELVQINATNSPYIIATLMPQSAWLTNYFALTHFSEANYVGMTSGQFTHCQQFDGSAASCHQAVPNLFAQLHDAGLTWTSWMESMPSPCFLTSTGGTRTQNHYGAKHNPAIFYDDIEGGGTWTDPAPASSQCVANDIPAGTTDPNDMSVFDGALAGTAGSPALANFNLVVPNECEDGHDNCPPQGNGVSQFNDFLSREVPKIQAWATLNDPNTVIIVTFDEGTSNRGPGTTKQFNGGGNVMFAVLGGSATAGVSDQSANHYSLLRTLEDGFGLSPLGGAATASPITGIWS
jgi:hypothetical protein